MALFTNKAVGSSTAVFTNKVAVITGASSGIGSALATALASEGCKVGLVARREPRLRELAEQIERTGSQAAVGIADIGQRDQVAVAMDAIREQLGPIDLLIANAGLGERDQVDPFNAEHFERLMRVNWIGVVNAIESVLPSMLKRQTGHLAAISSLRSFRGLPGFAGYGATKAAINTFMEGAACRHCRPRRGGDYCMSRICEDGHDRSQGLPEAVDHGARGCCPPNPVGHSPQTEAPQFSLAAGADHQHEPQSARLVDLPLCAALNERFLKRGVGF